MAGLVGHATSGYVHDKVFCDGREHALFLAQFGSKKNIQPGGKYYLPPGSTDCQPEHMVPLTGSHNPATPREPVLTTVDERRKLIAKVGGIPPTGHKVPCSSLRKGAAVEKTTLKWEVPFYFQLPGLLHKPDHQDTCVVAGSVATRTQLSPQEMVHMEEAAIVAKAKSLGLRVWVDNLTGKLQVENPKKPVPKTPLGGHRTVTVKSSDLGDPKLELGKLSDTGMVHDGAHNMSAKPMHSLPQAATALDMVNAVEKIDAQNLDEGIGGDAGASHEPWLGPKATLKGIAAHNARVQSGKTRKATRNEMGDDGSPPTGDVFEDMRDVQAGKMDLIMVDPKTGQAKMRDVSHSGYVMGQHTLELLDNIGLGTGTRAVQCISEAATHNPHTSECAGTLTQNAVMDLLNVVTILPTGGTGEFVAAGARAEFAAAKAGFNAAAKKTLSVTSNAVGKTLETVIGQEAKTAMVKVTENAVSTAGHGLMVPVKYGQWWGKQAGAALKTTGAAIRERGPSTLPLTGVKDATKEAIEGVSLAATSKPGKMISGAIDFVGQGVAFGAATGAFNPHEDNPDHKPVDQDHDVHAVDAHGDVSSDPHGRLHVGGSHQPDKPGPTKLVGKDSSNTYLIGALLAGGMLVAASA